MWRNNSFLVKTARKLWYGLVDIFENSRFYQWTSPHKNAKKEHPWRDASQILNCLKGDPSDGKAREIVEKIAKSPEKPGKITLHSAFLSSWSDVSKVALRTLTAAWVFAVLSLGTPYKLNLGLIVTLSAMILFLLLTQYFQKKSWGEASMFQKFFSFLFSAEEDRIVNTEQSQDKMQAINRPDKREARRE